MLEPPLEWPERLRGLRHRARMGPKVSESLMTSFPGSRQAVLLAHAWDGNVRRPQAEVFDHRMVRERSL